MQDYLLKFPSKAIAEQFGVAHGFTTEVDGVIQAVFSTHEYALHEIGEHNGADYWILFRDLVGIPIPEDADPFIYWASTWTVTDEDGNETPVPRPDGYENIPTVFWS